jgi:hypothetical protein
MCSSPCLFTATICLKIDPLPQKFAIV